MNSNPLFSFVIPAYKLQYLHESIDSILGQTYSEFELIVVNDKSPEDIKGLVDTYTDPRISYYENEQNIGRNDLVASWNHALSYAKGEYVILASDDDVYSADFLEQAKALIDVHPESELVRGRVKKIFDDGIVHEEECIFDHHMSQEAFAYYLIRHGFKCSANYIYKRIPFLKKGGFINFPCASYTDTATPLMMAKRGVLNISAPFYFRISACQLSSNFSIKVAEQKVKATYYFSTWIEQFLSSLPYSGFLTAARYLYREDICKQIASNNKHIPLHKIATWKKYVFCNSHLYKREKIAIIIARLTN